MTGVAHRADRKERLPSGSHHGTFLFETPVRCGYTRL